MTQNLPVSLPFDQLSMMAKAMAGSGLFGVKTEQQALALMLVAQAQGIPAATACVDFDVIQGKPAMTARAMLARFQEKGGTIKWIEYSDKVCEAEFTHKQCPNPVRVRWTLEDAARAGLLAKDTWKKYPRQMLSSRVMSEGVDRCYPSASGGFYPPEIVQDFEPRKDHDATSDAVPLPSAPITPTTGAMEALSAERQEVVMATASAVRQCLAENRPMDAYSLCETSGFDNDEKVALWTLLDSKARAALKRMQQAERAAERGISEPQKKRLEAIIKDYKLDREAVKTWCQNSYGKEHFSDLTPAEYTDLEATLKAMREDRDAQA